VGTKKLGWKKKWTGIKGGGQETALVVGNLIMTISGEFVCPPYNSDLKLPSEPISWLPPLISHLFCRGFLGLCTCFITWLSLYWSYFVEGWMCEHAKHVETGNLHYNTSIQCIFSWIVLALRLTDWYIRAFDCSIREFWSFYREWIVNHFLLSADCESFFTERGLWIILKGGWSICTPLGMGLLLQDCRGKAVPTFMHAQFINDSTVWYRYHIFCNCILQTTICFSTIIYSNCDLYPLVNCFTLC